MIQGRWPWLFERMAPWAEIAFEPCNDLVLEYWEDIAFEQVVPVTDRWLSPVITIGKGYAGPFGPKIDGMKTTRVDVQKKDRKWPLSHSPGRAWAVRQIAVRKDLFYAPFVPDECRLARSPKGWHILCLGRRRALAPVVDECRVL